MTLGEVEVRRKLEPLLGQYEAVSRKWKTVEIWKEQGWELKGIEILDNELMRTYKRLRRKIIKVARDELEMYRLAERELGFGGVCLATLLLCVDFSRGIQKIKGYARRCSRVRENLAKLAMAIYFAANRGANKNKYSEIVMKTEDREKALKRIQDEILKDLRRLYRRHFIKRA